MQKMTSFAPDAVGGLRSRTAPRCIARQRTAPRSNTTKLRTAFGVKEPLHFRNFNVVFIHKISHVCFHIETIRTMNF